MNREVDESDCEFGSKIDDDQDYCTNRHRRSGDGVGFCNLLAMRIRDAFAQDKATGTRRP